MQFPFIHDLQENIIDGRMRFLYLVKEDHRVGLLADFIHQHTALLIAHISRRRPVKQGGGVLLLEFGHIKTDHGLFIVEQRLRQCLGKFGLAGAGRPQQEEGADGLARLVHTAAGFKNGIGQCFQRLVLTDNPTAQVVFHVEQAFLLLRLYLTDRNTRLAGDNGGNLINSYLLYALFRK